MFIANKMSNDDYMKIPNIYSENQVRSWYNRIASNPIFKMFNMPDQMVKEMFAVGLNTATAWKNGELMPTSPKVGNNTAVPKSFSSTILNLPF